MQFIFSTWSMKGAYLSVIEIWTQANILKSNISSLPTQSGLPDKIQDTQLFLNFR